MRSVIMPARVSANRRRRTSARRGACIAALVILALAMAGVALGAV